MAAPKVDNCPETETEAEASKPVVRPARAQLLIKHILKKLRKPTLLFSSHRPVKPSIVEVVHDATHTCTTNAQRIIRDVFKNLRKSTFLFKSHRQSPSSLFVLVGPRNSGLPLTDIAGGVGSDAKPIPTSRRAESIIRLVFQELGKQRSVVFPSVSPQRPSESVSHPATSDLDTRSPSSQVIPSSCVPTHGPGVRVLARVKGWFMQARYAPNNIPVHQRRANFLEDE